MVEVLTHIKRRLSSRPLVQIPVEALLDQYKASHNSPYLQNFAIIFITMGYPRLNLETRSALAAKLIACEDKMEQYQDKYVLQCWNGQMPTSRSLRQLNFKDIDAYSISKTIDVAKGW